VTADVAANNIGSAVLVSICIVTVSAFCMSLEQISLATKKTLHFNYGIYFNTFVIKIASFNGLSWNILIFNIIIKIVLKIKLDH
jgi:hypothetical protein